MAPRRQSSSSRRQEASGLLLILMNLRVDERLGLTIPYSVPMISMSMRGTRVTLLKGRFFQVKTLILCSFANLDLKNYSLQWVGYH